MLSKRSPEHVFHRLCRPRLRPLRLRPPCLGVRRARALCVSQQQQQHGHVFTVPSEAPRPTLAKCARASGSGCARSYSWRPQHWVPKNVGRVAFGSCGDLEGAPPHQYKAAYATTRARTMRRMEGATMAVRRSLSPVQHKSTVSTAPSAPTAPTAAACRGGLHRLSSRR